MDDASFQRLHAATERPLWGYIFNSTGDAALADDLLQEAYLRMLTATIPEPVTDAHLRHYLFRIAANLIIDTHRGARRVVEMPADGPTVQSHEASIMDRQRVEEALARIRPKDRQLLWLAFVEKLSHREIAEQLSYREPSIRPLLHRAKRRILEILKGGEV
jgi:RNA polymerase sigma-70 factor (ECF subfamily)